MEASEFREAIGEFQTVQEDGSTFVKFSDQRKFDKVKRRVKVIASCSPEDKFVFVCGVKQKGGQIGMIGDRISDSEALKQVVLGFSQQAQ